MKLRAKKYNRDDRILLFFAQCRNKRGIIGMKIGK